MSRVVGIDGDIILYSAGFAAEGEPLPHCLHTVKKMIEKIVDATSADDYVVFLTGKDNYREEVATIQEYKGNRKENKKPTHYPDIKNYLISFHEAIVVDGMEADDALGIFLTDKDKPDDEERICASLDKDLDMIPGEHYNWRKEELYTVTEEEGNHFFFVQCLTGDACDNIPGLYKITGKKATKKVKELIQLGDTPAFQMQVVRGTYLKASAEKGGALGHLQDEVDEVATLLWIQRDGYEKWEDLVGDTEEERSEESSC